MSNRTQATQDNVAFMSYVRAHVTVTQEAANDAAKTVAIECDYLATLIDTHLDELREELLDARDTIERLEAEISERDDEIVEMKAELEAMNNSARM